MRAGHEMHECRANRTWNPRTEATARERDFLVALAARLDAGRKTNIRLVAEDMRVNSATASQFCQGCKALGLVRLSESGWQITDSGRALLAA